MSKEEAQNILNELKELTGKSEPIRLDYLPSDYTNSIFKHEDLAKQLLKINEEMYGIPKQVLHGDWNDPKSAGYGPQDYLVWITNKSNDIVYVNNYMGGKSRFMPGAAAELIVHESEEHILKELIRLGKIEYKLIGPAQQFGKLNK